MILTVLLRCVSSSLLILIQDYIQLSNASESQKQLTMSRQALDQMIEQPPLYKTLLACVKNYSSNIAWKVWAEC